MSKVEDDAVAWAQSLVERGYSSRIEPNASVAPYTTYKVGGPAFAVVEACCLADLECLSRAVLAHSLDARVLGRGSNVLVADAGFRGVIVVLDGEFTTHEIIGTTVIAGAAVALPALARQSVARGLAGFEWAVGVPGSVGGAVRMNAGGHGADMAASVQSADVFNFDTATLRSLTAEQLSFGYRSSSITPADVVVRVTIELERGDIGVSQGQLRDIVTWRREHQPGGQNAGSVFTNPDGESAGALIDQLGLKGFRIGTAAISDKHANFIQADPAGSADDVYAVMLAVQERVMAEFGIHLHPETVLLGFDADLASQGFVAEEPPPGDIEEGTHS